MIYFLVPCLNAIGDIYIYNYIYNYMDMDGYGPFPQKMNTIIVNGCFVWGVRFRRRDLSSRLLLQTQHIAWIFGPKVLADRPTNVPILQACHGMVMPSAQESEENCTVDSAD